MSLGVVLVVCSVFCEILVVDVMVGQCDVLCVDYLIGENYSGYVECQVLVEFGVIDICVFKLDDVVIMDFNLCCFNLYVDLGLVIIKVVCG